MLQSRPLDPTITVQANVLQARRNAHHAHYHFLSFADPTGAGIRGFIRDALKYVVTWSEQQRGSKLPNEAWLNIGLSREGLNLAARSPYVSAELDRKRMLQQGYPELEWALDAEADAFTHPMRHRLPLLGEDDADWTWDLEWLPPQYVADQSLTFTPIHVFAWVSGTSSPLVASRVAQVAATWTQHGGTSVLDIVGALPANGLEHFGFRDGLSQPAIEGVQELAKKDGRGALRVDKDGNRTWDLLPPGEFVTGLTRTSMDGQTQLGDEGYEVRDPEPLPFLEHCTYLAFRQIEQRVDRWKAFLAKHAPPGPGGSAEVASWLLGRSPGTPGDHLLGDLTRKIVYSADPEGIGCPLGAHVRRAHPRDGLGFDGRRSNRHRIIRRGLPYGDPANGPAGLAFIAMQARLEDGFEFIQRHWLNDGSTLHVGSDPDPIAGIAPLRATGAGQAVPLVDRPRFVKQAAPVQALPLPTRPASQAPDERFTIVRGGEYFVLPTRTGLSELANA